jgi:hypothetical protein
MAELMERLQKVDDSGNTENSSNIRTSASSKCQSQTQQNAVASTLGATFNKLLFSATFILSRKLILML